MPLPRAVARFNHRYTNRFLEPLAERSSHFVRLHHRGRHSARAYATPLWAFPADDGLVVVLTYGPNVDWLRNVQAGPASVEGSVSGIITGVGVAHRDSFASSLPRYVRLVMWLLRIPHVAVLAVVPE